MGSYSYFRWEDIKVKDWKGLVEFLKFYKKHFDNDYLDGEEENGIKSMVNLKEKGFSFESWDGYKLIEYWYPSTLIFLIGVAKYIEGEVSFLYETDEETATIKFENGECILSLGRTIYEDVKPEDLIVEKEEKKKIKEILTLLKI